MADDGSKQREEVWPLPKFYFSVDLGGGMELASFQEVMGLDIESQIIEYRHGDSPQWSTIKMPGIIKSSNVTLKKGILVKDDQFYNWYSSIEMNTVKRTTVAIKLLDEEGNPTITWTLQNAWPTKITGTNLNADGNKVAIETIEIAHEGLVIANE